VGFWRFKKLNKTNFNLNLTQNHFFMNPYSENNLVEQFVIKLIGDLWGDPDCHINAYGDSQDARLGRNNRSEVVLVKYLKPALEKLNPNIPEDGINLAIEAITKSRSHLTLINANQEVYKLLRDGVTVDLRQEDGTMATEIVRIFDFTDAQNNDFLLVSQMWIAGEIYTKRPDLIVFVNGIPLLNIELKSTEKNLRDALTDNITPYKESIPQLYYYNLGLIISNGIENKLGSITSPFEYFNEWKKVSSENDEPKGYLTTIINGICDKNRLLDILENFVLFDTGKAKTSKIIPRYFQYHGVNKAFEGVLNREKNEGKLGVFWHTQGSGKSYSMVFLSQKVLRRVVGNFTFVIVTDRGDLDRQSYDNFANVGAVYEAQVQATSIVNLKELLGQDHRQIFTTIQKFQDIPGAISLRSDIIIMTDEAHRSQYSQMATNMRKALPNASFIGFTGTPLLAEGSEKTRETFGDYVSVYNFGQSVQDRATVPLYYENRIVKLKNVNNDLELQMDQIADRFDLGEEEEEKLEQEFSTFYHLITREDRLDTIARDIVEHYAARGYDGKAMVVSIDKKTSVRMYIKVQEQWQKYLAKLRLDLSRENDEYKKNKIVEKLDTSERVEMGVIVSQDADEIEKMAQYDIDMKEIRGRMKQKTTDGKSSLLETEFKNPDSSLRIVFVCAMWLTGFDVPNLSTLYLDKPLRNHTLMQAIARANRVAENKPNGLIVDYIGVFKNLQKALALYASTGSTEYPISPKSDLVEKLEKKLQDLEKFLELKDIYLDKFFQANEQEKIALLERSANILLENSNVKKAFLADASDLYQTYLSVLPDPSGEEFYLKVIIIKTIAHRVRTVGSKSIDISAVQGEMEDLLDKSIQTGQYTIAHYKKLVDLSALDANGLRDYFEKLENKNLQLESLKAEITEKLEKLISKNKNRLKFMDRLNSLLSSYNNEAHDVEEIVSELIKFSKELDEEGKRGFREGLEEEQLAVFDLLCKESLNPGEKDRVKTEKITHGWRDFEPTRSRVRKTIADYIYQLPDPEYTQTECEQLVVPVYNHVYEYFV
jgi:type I restriction enzyme R subunit